MSDRAEKLLTIRHNVSRTPHIVLDTEKCTACLQKPCLYFCPVGCFSLEDNEIKFQYEGCLECGTCRVMCGNNALTWDYPQGGFGVSVRLG
ncbi:4Fe-4S ferredoxin-type iron-sulfur binding domain profile [Desulfitobacterium hafniense]|uniref:4Fe-4S ferredoxin-type iron-sulfur binding domain profile n=1 Tax=Desulfitobacterium hafniense TaxID=49338 RepID=A0A098B7Y9_DESHA|nr:4Fe-4S dicluster domain-containing protein [Desulfitobacterium hafniense]CDX03961.1 4Fe-4S ferredoxin-type iron-sulfur binding domain profile [Desulfitobacterium hafniense]